VSAFGPVVFGALVALALWWWDRSHHRRAVASRSSAHLIPPGMNPLATSTEQPTSSTAHTPTRDADDRLGAGKASRPATSAAHLCEGEARR
jgi:hypothetical protein